MKFYLTYLFLCLLVTSTLFAQSKELDSLQSIYETSKDDTNKVLLAHQLVWKYLSFDTDKTKKYNTEGLLLARKLGFKRGEMYLLNRLGDFYTHQGDYSKGVEYATQSLKVAEQIKDSVGIADAYLMLGIIYSNNLKRYQTALDYYEKALPIYTQRKIKNSIVATYNTIAQTLAMTKQQLPRAYQYTNASVEIAKGLNNEDFLGWCLSVKGIVYKETNLADSALFYLSQAINHYQKANDATNVVINNLLIGLVYLEQKQADKALKTYQNQIKPVIKLNAKGLLRDAYQGLSDTYALQKRYDSAYHYHVLYMQLKDSLINDETTKRVSLVEADYEQEKQEIKIASLEKEKRMIEEEKQLVTIFFIIFILGLLIIMTLIIRNNRAKRRANLLLTEKNEEIAAQNEELQQSKEEIATQRDLVKSQNNQLQKTNDTKDKLFSIISHDLRSPIGSLKNLFDLIAQNQVSVEDFKAIFFPKLRHSVGSLYDTLDNMLQWSYSQMEGIKSNPEKIDIQTVVNDTIALFSEIAIAKQITITPRVPSGATAYADLNQVRLVMRNLLNNALKFTLEKGMITITATQIEGFVEIAVKDTGMGMTENQLKSLFDPTTRLSTRGTSGERGTGLGLILCKEMIESNGGQIRVESIESHGSIFVISLPIE